MSFLCRLQLRMTEGVQPGSLGGVIRPPIDHRYMGLWPSNPPQYSAPRSEPSADAPQRIHYISQHLEAWGKTYFKKPMAAMPAVPGSPQLYISPPAPKHSIRIAIIFLDRTQKTAHPVRWREAGPYLPPMGIKSTLSLPPLRYL